MITILSQATFVPPGPPMPGTSVTIRVGQPVPPGFVVMDRSITATISKGILVQLTQTTGDPPAPVQPSTSPTSPKPNPPSAIQAPPSLPPGFTYDVSKGGSYTTPTGSSMVVPAGVPVPPGWSPAAGTPAPVSSNVASLADTMKEVSAGVDVSSGGYYSFDGPISDYKYIASGVPVPPGWTLAANTPEVPALPKSIGGYYVSSNGPKIYLLAGSIIPPGYALQNAAAPPLGNPKTSSWQLSLVQILGIAGVIGAAGVAALSVMVVVNPAAVKTFLERFDAFRNVIIDAAQVLVAATIITTLGFVIYEFVGFYKEEGSVVGAIGRMTAASIETMVIALVDTLEQLAKDAFTWMKDEIGSIF